MRVTRKAVAVVESTALKTAPTWDQLQCPCNGGTAFFTELRVNPSTALIRDVAVFLEWPFDVSYGVITEVDEQSLRTAGPFLTIFAMTENSRLRLTCDLIPHRTT